MWKNFYVLSSNLKRRLKTKSHNWWQARQEQNSSVSRQGVRNSRVHGSPSIFYKNKGQETISPRFSTKYFRFQFYWIANYYFNHNPKWQALYCWCLFHFFSLLTILKSLPFPQYYLHSPLFPHQSEQSHNSSESCLTNRWKCYLLTPCSNPGSLWARADTVLSHILPERAWHRQ